MLLNSVTVPVRCRPIPHVYAIQHKKNTNYIVIKQLEASACSSHTQMVVAF